MPSAHGMSSVQMGDIKHVGEWHASVHLGVAAESGYKERETRMACGFRLPHLDVNDTVI